MDCLNILVSAYKPNTAPTNRILSFLRGFSQLGVKVEVVFVYPNVTSDRLGDFELTNLKKTYLWDRYKCRNKLYKYIRSFSDVRRWAKMLPTGSSVFLFGSSEYLPVLVKRKDLRIYQERTEHPNANPLVPAFLQK